MRKATREKSETEGLKGMTSIKRGGSLSNKKKPISAKSKQASAKNAGGGRPRGPGLPVKSWKRRGNLGFRGGTEIGWETSREEGSISRTALIKGGFIGGENPRGGTVVRVSGFPCERKRGEKCFG